MTNRPKFPSPALLQDERLDEVNEHLRLIQKKNGLTFGTDAYLLAAFARPVPLGRAIDLGSGTGIVSLLLATKEKAATVYAVEVQESFAELIAKNAKINGLEERVIPICADLRTLTAQNFDGEVDLIVSNPPYMRCDSGKRNLHDEKYIARHEVCGSIKDFCCAAAKLLKYGGRFVTVWRPDRLCDLLTALRETKLEPKRLTFVHADAKSEPCMVLTEAVLGAAPSMRVTAPLMLYLPRTEGENRRRFTEEAQQIYDSCSFLEPNN